MHIQSQWRSRLAKGGVTDLDYAWGVTVDHIGLDWPRVVLYF